MVNNVGEREMKGGGGRDVVATIVINSVINQQSTDDEGQLFEQGKISLPSVNCLRLPFDAVADG